MNTYRNLTGWVIAILMVVAQPAVAQQRYDGTWNKIHVTTSGSGIEDFNFKDSLFGLARDYYGIESSIDGGHSWQLDTVLTYIGTKACLNTVEVSGSHEGIIFATGGPSEYTTVVLWDSIFQVYAPEGGDNGSGLYVPIAEHMVDSVNGYRLVQELDYHSQIIDTVLFLATHDAWQNSVSYGLPYAWSGPPDPFASSQNFFSGLLLDSSETWTVDVNTILHTTNAGATWDRFQPADTSRYHPQWKDFFVDTATREVYAEAEYGNVDFAYSSDYGVTWRLDSTFGQGLWRMAVPASGIIWGMLGNGGIANFEIEPFNAQLDPSELSNKVAYSSDYGKSWYIDSVTFAGDTLLEMHFTDARHGWIAGYANGDSHIWYYDADKSIVDATTQIGVRVSLPYLVVYPNPTQTTISVNGSTLSFNIVDPLGRLYSCPQRNGTVDVSGLPPGIYFVSDGYVSGKFVKE